MRKISERKLSVKDRRGTGQCVDEKGVQFGLQKYGSAVIINNNQFNLSWSMRNRQIIQYLIYPKCFNAHSVLYKGTYCISFKLYSITSSKTLTYAYPFPVKGQENQIKYDHKQQPAIHADSNFSYLTHKFQIIYEEQKKKIDSQCIFRLEFDKYKPYEIVLQVKLLRKVSSPKADEAGLCVRKGYDIKFQTINEQQINIKRTSFNVYQRILFRASQFYSSVDLYICNFNYGYKYYRSKAQISNHFNIDLNHQNQVTKMRQRLESQRKMRRQEFISFKAEILEDYENLLPQKYLQLIQMVNQYTRIMKIYQNLLSSIIGEYRNVLLCEIYDLRYILMQDRPQIRRLQDHYQVWSPEEILSRILEQQQLLRKNIRKLREKVCQLIIHLPEKQFYEIISTNMTSEQYIEERAFVKYVSDLTHIETLSLGEVQQKAVDEFIFEKSVWNKKILQMPLFFIQSSKRSEPVEKKATSLAVFVHGYQGNSFDFQKAKNYLKKSNRHAHVLIIESITNDMSQSIEILGKQTAEEVIKHIKNSIIHFTSINFIGFSLGGLIARSAFAFLQDYWGRFNLFITFSSPHLGISECDNSLVNIGVWFLIKVDRVKNLKELNFQSVKFNDSVLMKLSTCEGLAQFKKVVLVCSKNDGFVPYYSTVLDENKCESSEIKALCRNITAKIKQIDRVQMFFDIENSGTLDKLTGRKGHIEFLDNDYFLEIFFRLYGPLL